jgi:hypothetical protein
MSEPTVSFSGRTITVAGKTWQAPWPITQAAVIDDRVILLYDYMAGPGDRQFQNLEAFSFSDSVFGRRSTRRPRKLILTSRF